MRPTYPMH